MTDHDHHHHDLDDRLRDLADALMTPTGAVPIPLLRAPVTRVRFAPVLATASLITVGVGGLYWTTKGGSGPGERGAAPASLDSTTAGTSTTSSTSSSSSVVQVVVASTEAPVVTSHLSMPLGRGMMGVEVERVQTRLDELGFFVGPIDGQFGGLTEKAVWAFEKLVMQVPRADATGVVTDEMWQFMQQPIEIEPRRSFAAGEATVRHVEIYLPEQVVAFFDDDVPVLISHMSSGTGEEWKEVVTIDPGEIGNENGTEPLERREIGVSVTPGGIFAFDRMVEGTRESALGSMWDPAYFNYGIAIHGALNVPLTPASHGCIRVPMDVGQVFHEFIEVGDQVFVWDGVKEPEWYDNFPDRGYPQGELPIFNRVDHTYTTTTVTPTTTTTATTLPAPTTQPRVTQPAVTPAPVTQAPVTQPAPTDPPVTVPAPTEPATTTTVAAGGFGPATDD